MQGKSSTRVRAAVSKWRGVYSRITVSPVASGSMIFTWSSCAAETKSASDSPVSVTRWNSGLSRSTFCTCSARFFSSCRTRCTRGVSVSFVLMTSCFVDNVNHDPQKG
jgi:hypothetical protein